MMKFNGPLFIVGLPRSGTKLLRDLLNNHSKISIPVHESHFIPSLVNHFGLQYNADTSDKKNAIYRHLMVTKFVNNYSNKITQASVFTDGVFAWNTFFKNVLCFYSPKLVGESIIWGDKTPNYILHYKLLNTIYPSCKFIHIVRDPRDNVLSVKKAWGRSITGAALKWSEVMKYVEKEKLQEKQNYIEVKYEDLITRLEPTLRSLCDFIGIDFEPQMNYLKKPAENLGDTKHTAAVVSANFNKYKNAMGSSLLKKVEGIVAKYALARGYEINNQEEISLSVIDKKLVRLYDMMQAMLFHIKEKGFFKGVKYTFRLHADSKGN